MTIFRTPGALLAGLALMISSASAHVAATDVNEIVKKTKALYASTPTAEVKFEQSGPAGTMSGTLLYAKGNRYRLDVTGQTTASDGQRTWLYNNAKNQVVISRATTGGARLTPNEILTAFPGTYAVKLAGEGKVNGRGVWLVRCTPGTGERIGDVSAATLYIDKQTSRFQQIDIDSPTLGQMKIRIVSARYGVKIPDARFTIVPPRGAKVIDLSK